MNRLKISEIIFGANCLGHLHGVAAMSIFLDDGSPDHSFPPEPPPPLELTVEEILERIEDISRAKPWLIWTGPDEPTGQLRLDHVQFFHERGYRQAAIVHGAAHVAPGLFDWTILVPTVEDHIARKNFPSGVDEIRYRLGLCHDSLPSSTIPARFRYIVPIIGPDYEENMRTIRHVHKLILRKDPEWRLTLPLDQIFEQI